MQPYDWEEVHALVLRETFEELDADRAVALVGVLDDYRIPYSDRLREVVEPVEGHRFVKKMVRRDELP
ncbi:MAG: hypothetical protein R3F30_00645 [Planctomycetota bacterium]